MRYDRTVIGYHGCDVTVAGRLLDGDTFTPSENDFDWLGSGIYFWEYGADRALRFAEEQKNRGKVQTPAVVGAVIQLGRCFDLLDTRFTQALSETWPKFEEQVRRAGEHVPTNAGSTPDRKLRRLDCAVINWALRLRERVGESYDTVRGGFTEGGPVFPNAGFQRETHIQLAVRNPACILGVFRPTRHTETK